MKAKAQLEEELAVEQQANRAYEAYRAHGRMKNGRRLGAPPKPYAPPEQPDGKVNLSDPDSKLVHGMRGWVQGYNAQAVCNEQHLVLADEVMTASPDFGHLEPMFNAAQAQLAGAGVSERPRGGRRGCRLLAPGANERDHGKGSRGADPTGLDPPQRRATRMDGGAYAFMRSVLAGERGKALYRQRAQLVEPIFGHTKHNRGFTPFARRGRAAVRTEWRLLVATHNLLKLHQHFAATA